MELQHAAAHQRVRRQRVRAVPPTIEHDDAQPLAGELERRRRAGGAPTDDDDVDSRRHRRAHEAALACRAVRPTRWSATMAASRPTPSMKSELR